MRRIVPLVLCAIVLALTQTACFQENARLVGWVYGPAGTTDGLSDLDPTTWLAGERISSQTGLPGTRIVVSSLFRKNETVTGPDGSFEIWVKPGTYNIIADHANHRPVTIHSRKVSANTTTVCPPVTLGVFHYLFIGVNHYPSPEISSLSGCVNDALAFSDAWVSTSPASTNSLAGTGQILLDAQASKAGIRQAILDLLANARFGDTVVVTFGGHGASVKTDNLNDRYLTYILPSDATLDKSTWISEDELQEWFLWSPTPHVVFIFDSCQSGGMVKSLDGETSEDPSNLILSLDRPGFVVMMGASATEYSYETFFDGKKRGVFSYFLTQGIQYPHPADKDENGMITAKEMFNYAAARTQAYWGQTPELWKGVSDIVLYRYNR